MKSKKQETSHRNRKFRRWLSRAFLLSLTALTLTYFIVPEDAFARRGGFRGGSFRSRSSSWGSSKSKSSWGSSRSSKKLSSRSASKKQPLSKADRSLYKRASSKGTVYRSRADAEKAFVNKNQGEFNNKFDSKPSTRPDYIPNTTSVGGKKYDVNYNPTYGGYGYMGPGGAWVAYSVIRDVTMMNMLMRRNDYYYDEETGRTERRSGIGSSFWSGIFIFGMLFVLANSFRRL